MRKALLPVVAVIGLASCAQPGAVPAGVRPTLECGGRPTVGLIADFAGSEAEPRNPQQIAEDIAEHETESFRGERRVTLDDGDKMEIAVSDRAGATTAILSFSRHGDLGWRLDQAVSCSTTVKP